MDTESTISHLKTIGFLEPGVDHAFLDNNLDISAETLRHVQEHYSKIGTPIIFRRENPIIDGLYGWNLYRADTTATKTPAKPAARTIILWITLISLILITSIMVLYT